MKHILLTILLAFSVIGASCANSLSQIDTVERSIVSVQFQLPDGQFTVCAGFVVDAAKGWVLTAKHCVPDDANEEIIVAGNASTLVKKSASLALVTIPPMTKPPLEIRSKPVNIGETVRTFGFGHGLMTVFTRTVALLFDQGHVVMDGTLLEGMSGGPVVDAEGKVLGINQAVYFNAVGIACGQDEIRNFLK